MLEKPSNTISTPNKQWGTPQPEGFPPPPADWSTEIETFPSADGAVQLFGMHLFRGKSREKAGPRALVILHGQGEHGGRYLHVAHYLKDQVDHVYCLDHRGHGRSEGIRGHVDSFNQYVEDAVLAIHRMHENLIAWNGRAELHLLGHSMGGLIALRVLFLHANLPLKSATISAPLLGLKMKVPAIKRLAGNALSRIMGALQMETGLDFRLVSRDPAVQKLYGKDRLVHSKATPRFFTELQNAMADTVGRDSGIAVPVLAIMAGADGIVDVEVERNFFSRLKLGDKEIREYPENYHESLNELNKEQVFEDIAAWIHKHSNKS